MSNRNVHYQHQQPNERSLDDIRRIENLEEEITNLDGIVEALAKAQTRIAGLEAELARLKTEHVVDIGMAVPGSHLWLKIDDMRGYVEGLRAELATVRAERDAAIARKGKYMSNKKDLGLYKKFIIARTDGRHLPGEKHEHCQYFVLDLSHDKHAPAAVAAYAESCKDEYPALAIDLYSWLVKDGKRIEGYDSYAFAEKFEIANPVAPTAAVDANVMDKNTSNHPQKCPVTGRDFFLVLDHPTLGNVATYGGPYDSYTIPEWNGEEFRSERFDHDAGEWVEGGEPYPFVLVDESELIKIQEAAS